MSHFAKKHSLLCREYSCRSSTYLKQNCFLDFDRKCNLLIRIKQKWDKRFNELKPDNSWSDKNRVTGWWLSVAEMLLYLNNVKKKEILQLYPGEWQKTISKWDFKSEPVEGLVDRFKTNFFSSLQHVSNPFDL